MLRLSLKLPVILCLCWTSTATSLKVNEGVRGVQWRETGDTVTIQCRSSAKHEKLDLRLGLNREFQVFHRDGRSGKDTISNKYNGRLQTSEAGKALNIDILIKNLSSKDTGPYWCMYNKYDTEVNEFVKTEGNGSVLPVVKDKRTDSDERAECRDSTLDRILLCFVFIGAVLLLCIIAFLMHKKIRSKWTPRKPGRVSANDVYEDMRSTLRA